MPPSSSGTAAPPSDRFSSSAISWVESLPRRGGGLTVALGCAAVLGLALWLSPAIDGHGTHTQLGLPACAWAATVNRPCPTCGMTTAFAYAVRGRLADALVAQPFGLLLAIGTAAALWAGLHVALTGSQLGRLCGRLLAPRVLWTLTALAAASWAYKWATWPPG